MNIPNTREFMLDVSSRLASKGFKMVDLANKIKYSQASLSQARKGHMKITLEKAQQINSAVNEMIDEQK